MAKGATIKEVLNDPEGRELVDAIEDTLSSLRGGGERSPLREILARQIQELLRKTGYRYRIDHE